MGSRNEEPTPSENNSDLEVMPRAERKAFSGPLGSSSSTKAWRRIKSLDKRRTTSTSTENDDDEAYVEITLDILDDSVAVHSVQAAGGGGHEDPQLALLAKKTLEGKKSASFRSSLLRNTSTHIRQVSQELKRLASFSKRSSGAARRFDRTRSATAHALKSLKFITAKASAANGWASVEKRFDDLTAGSNGLLNSSLFGECIGT